MTGSHLKALAGREGAEPRTSRVPRCRLPHPRPCPGAAALKGRRMEVCRFHAAGWIEGHLRRAVRGATDRLAPTGAGAYAARSGVSMPSAACLRGRPRRSPLPSISASRTDTRTPLKGCVRVCPASTTLCPVDMSDLSGTCPLCPGDLCGFAPGRFAHVPGDPTRIPGRKWLPISLGSMDTFHAYAGSRKP